MSGSVILIEGGVLLFSRTRRCVSHSRSVAEHIAMSECLKDNILLRASFTFMRSGSKEQKVVMYEDNEGATRPANNPVSSARQSTLMFGVIFTRDGTEEGHFVMKHFKTGEQHPDILTKPTTLDCFMKRRGFICGS